MNKYAREIKREAQDLTKVWGPRAWLLTAAIIAAAVLALACGTVEQHWIGRMDWVDAFFGALPLFIIVLAVGLLPIFALSPLAVIERSLRKAAAAAALQAVAQARANKKAAGVMSLVARALAVSAISALRRFLSIAAARRVAENTWLICLTPRVLAQRPFTTRVPRG